MRFQVEITPIAESQIEQAYCWYRERNPEFANRWFRGLMNAISTLFSQVRLFSSTLLEIHFLGCLIINLLDLFLHQQLPTPHHSELLLPLI